MMMMMRRRSLTYPSISRPVSRRKRLLVMGLQLEYDMGGGGSNNSSIDEEELERYCIGGVDLSCRRSKLMKKKKKNGTSSQS